MSILVVDDSRAMRMIVLRELRKAGYDTKDVVEADNGRSALEHLRSGGIDLVLSDWNMPDMNGIRLLQILRQEGNRVPFGFVTSESNALVHREALDAGADFVVVKPFTADDLAKRVDSALGGHRQADGLGAALRPKEATVSSVLEELLGRPVATAESDPPRLSLAGAVAGYRCEAAPTPIWLVAEIGVAASVGAALSRLPAGAAEQFISEGALPEAAQENLYEVANVLSQVVPGYGERYALEGVSLYSCLRDHSEAALASTVSWSQPLLVTVEGYPAGRTGWLRG